MSGDRAVLLVLRPLALMALAVALWWAVRRRAHTGGSAPPVPDDALVVPVRALHRFTFPFGSSRSSISPRLAIASDGLHFKVFAADYWPFGTIGWVDAKPTLFGARVVVKTRSGGRTLFADLADETLAENLLRALPSDLPLAPRARAMRERRA